MVQKDTKCSKIKERRDEYRLWKRQNVNTGIHRIVGFYAGIRGDSI